MSRFNYTGRKTIARKHADIALNSFVVGGRKKFLQVIADIDFSAYDFAENAPVFIDIYSNDYSESVRFGSAGNPKFAGPSTIPLAPEIRDLKVRVKVLSPEPDSAQIIGFLRGFAPSVGDAEGDAQRKSLIAVRSSDLEGEIWKLEMEEDPDDAPVLIIDKLLGDHLALFNTPWFAASIMAQVFKEILIRILIVAQYDDDEDCNWTKWVRFAMQFSPNREKPPSLNETGKEVYAQSALAWIEDVVKKFSREQKYLDAFRKHLEVMRT